MAIFGKDRERGERARGAFDAPASPGGAQVAEGEKMYERERVRTTSEDASVVEGTDAGETLVHAVAPNVDSQAGNASGTEAGKRGKRDILYLFLGACGKVSGGLSFFAKAEKRQAAEVVAAGIFAALSNRVGQRAFGLFVATAKVGVNAAAIKIN